METIYSILAGNATSGSGQPAIIGTEGTVLTHAALHRNVQSLIRELKLRGITRQDRVALVLPDGPDMVVAFLAVSSVCACAPLNPAYKSRDFTFYLDDLQAKALITGETEIPEATQVAVGRGIPVWSLGKTTNNGGTGFGFSDSSTERENQSDTSFDPPDPESIALILHTSGTTSRPKMVPLTHRNLTTSAGNVAGTLQLVPEDRGLVVMPLFHIHGLVGALLSALHAGSSVVCSPGFSAAAFFPWAKEHEVSWYSAVPTMHQALLAQAASDPGCEEGLAIRVARSSSASLPPKVFHDLAKLWLAPVIESYGMTEAAHQMTSNPMPPNLRKPGSVGLPAGPEVAIIDEEGQLLEQGHTGAIVIKGPNVTAGYLNNPEANQTGFTQGWFQTGDQGYFDADGYLFLTGRLKEMINRGGENIAPREIDEVLLEHTAVAQATAFAIPHDSLGEDLAAAVVLRPGLSAGEGELRSFVAERLAPFKVPNRIVFVDSIPKGPTGKLQRIGLHQKLQSYLEIEYVEPESGLEAFAAGVFRTILGVGRVGLHDNFFSLGGDSLKATRVISAIRDAYPGEYPLTLVFQHPTAGQLAGFLEVRLNQGTDELEQLARELANLPPEEIERLLAEEKDG